jgi:hypothetical protein
MAVILIRHYLFQMFEMEHFSEEFIALPCALSLLFVAMKG